MSTDATATPGAHAPLVTRFAPSPTGFLHIGGARTALFNWLLARNADHHHGAGAGRYLLRIEDTDRERSTDAAITAILDGLTWLGLESDAPAVMQFARVERHREIADQLLAAGKAYRCYCSREELDAMREAARAEGRPPGYDGTWRDRDPSEAPEGVAPAIRLKTPRDGETVIDDAVQGRVVIANKELDDLIILRSDGTPTYMLAVVVDDHDMGVTHVVRGDDHLTNAARQTQIFHALGWPVPQFAHVPLIHGSDGAKLSKRHGALGVEAYRSMGYLPEALRNYLARLGWSHGNDEIIPTGQLIEWFGLEAIGRSPSRFDFKKLESLNAHYIKTLPPSALIAQLRSDLAHLDPAAHPDGATQPLPQISRALTDAQWTTLEEALPVLRERAKTLIDLIDAAAFLFAERPVTPGDPQAAKALEGDAPDVLRRLHAALVDAPEWTAEALEPVLKSFLSDQGLKMPQLGKPLRAALTGRLQAPGLGDCLALLGREEALARIADAADRG